ncbi:acyl-CoA dehydrogenase family protein [Falsirhodobacter sp. 1013]
MNDSLQMVPGVARTILNFGTEDQKERWLPRLATGNGSRPWR